MTNQDETSPGGINEDDTIMGGEAQDFAADNCEAFAQGELDVKAQMDLAQKSHNFVEPTEEKYQPSIESTTRQH